MARVKNILITGGSGNIGMRLVNQLLGKGYMVRVADVKPPEQKQIDFVRVDITNWEDMDEATRGIDLVIHLAAIPIENGQSRDIFRVNMEGTFNTIDAAAKNGVKCFLLASSVVVYALLNPSQPFQPAYFPVDEQTPLIPDRNYSVGKTNAENYMKAYSRLYGMDCIALRLATVMSESKGSKWAWDGVIENIDDPEYNFGGLSMRQFMWQYVYVEDVAQAFVKAVEYADANENIGFDAFNIGAEDCCSSLPTMELIGRYFPNVPLLKEPGRFAKNPYAALYGIEKAKKVLGYQPAYSWRNM